MSSTSEALQTQIHHRLAKLQTLRDEIRVRIHSAGLDVKDAWDRIEPQVASAELMATEASPAARSMLDRVLQKIARVHESLFAKAS
jgi:hypothetical protein